VRRPQTKAFKITIKNWNS